jgi:hypothetical protein
MFLVGSYVHEFLAVDTALDSGASWNYSTMEADYTASHPYIPFSQRHQKLIVLSLISTLISVVYMLRLAQQRSSPNCSERGSSQ